MKGTRARALVHADALLEEGKPEGDLQAFYGNEQGTALTLAISSGHLEAADLLLAAGANPNVCANERTPLARAVFARELALVKKLAAKGADVKWLKQEIASGRATAIKGRWLTQLQGVLG